MTVTTLIRLAVAASLAATLAPAQGAIVKKKKSAPESTAEQSVESVQERIARALQAIGEDELTPAQRKKVMAKLKEALARLEKGGEHGIVVVEEDGEVRRGEPKLMRWTTKGEAVELSEAEKGAWVIGGKEGAAAKAFTFRAQEPNSSPDRSEKFQKQLEAATKGAKEAQEKVQVLMRKLAEHSALELHAHGLEMERVQKAVEEAREAAERGEHGAMVLRLGGLEGDKAMRLEQKAEELRARAVPVEPMVLELEGAAIEVEGGKVDIKGLQRALEGKLHVKTGEAEEIVQYEVLKVVGDENGHRVWVTKQGDVPEEIDVKVDQRLPAPARLRELPARVEVHELHDSHGHSRDADLREMIEQMRAELREMRAMIRDIQQARAPMPASREASDRGAELRRARRVHRPESSDAPAVAPSSHAAATVVAPRPEFPEAPLETAEPVEVVEPPAPPAPARALRLRR